MRTASEQQEQELQDARDRGRWLSDDEQAAVDARRLQDQLAEDDKRNLRQRLIVFTLVCILSLLCAAGFCPHALSAVSSDSRTDRWHCSGGPGDGNVGRHRFDCDLHSVVDEPAGLSSSAGFISLCSTVMRRTSPSHIAWRGLVLIR